MLKLKLVLSISQTPLVETQQWCAGFNVQFKQDTSPFGKLAKYNRDDSVIQICIRLSCYTCTTCLIHVIYYEVKSGNIALSPLVRQSTF